MSLSQGDGSDAKHLVHFRTHDLHSDLVFATQQAYDNAKRAAATSGEDMEIQHYKDAIVNSFPRVMNRVDGMKRVIARASELCPKTKVVPAFVWTCDTIKCRSARGRTLLVSAKCVSKDKDWWEAAACLWCRDMRIGCDITNVRLVLRSDAEEILPATRKRKRVADEHSSDRSSPQPYQRMTAFSGNTRLATPGNTRLATPGASTHVAHVRAGSSRTPKNSEIEILKERLTHKTELNKMLVKANEDKDRHLADKDKVIEALVAENGALRSRLGGVASADQALTQRVATDQTLAQRVAALEMSTRDSLDVLTIRVDAYAQALTEIAAHGEQLAAHKEQLIDHDEQLSNSEDKYEWVMRNCCGFDLDADGNWVKPAEVSEAPQHEG